MDAPQRQIKELKRMLYSKIKEQEEQFSFKPSLTTRHFKETTNVVDRNLKWEQKRQRSKLIQMTYFRNLDSSRRKKGIGD
jgi:hypothetical protein